MGWNVTQLFWKWNIPTNSKNRGKRGGKLQPFPIIWLSSQRATGKPVIKCLAKKIKRHFVVFEGHGSFEAETVRGMQKLDNKRLRNTCCALFHQLHYIRTQLCTYSFYWEAWTVKQHLYSPSTFFIWFETLKRQLNPNCNTRLLFF